MASVAAGALAQQAPSWAAERQVTAPDQLAETDAPAGPSIEEAGTLNLMCSGGGSANKTDVTTAHGSSDFSGDYSGRGGYFGQFSGSGSSSATIIGQRSQAFGDQVSLRMQGTEGQVRMPRTMLPPIHGGDDGWFKLKNIKIKPNEITASVGVNFINSPKLRLDRYSGAISISGKAGDYSGQCQRFDPQQLERRF